MEIHAFQSFFFIRRQELASKQGEKFLEGTLPVGRPGWAAVVPHLHWAGNDEQTWSCQGRKEQGARGGRDASSTPSDRASLPSSRVGRRVFQSSPTGDFNCPLWSAKCRQDQIDNCVRMQSRLD